jgi:N-alpha-acetyltransferase 15/16, NatA auxiliary subunit
MQCQLRMYDALVDSRYSLLKYRPNLRQNWIGMAVAYHLQGNLKEARRLIEFYNDVIKVCWLARFYDTS